MKSVLFELGILKNGIEIFKKNFYMIGETKLNDYHIQFITREIYIDEKSLPITYRLYLIGDKKLNTNFLGTLLTRIMNFYLEKYEQNPESNIIIQIPPNSEFEDEVIKIISGL